MLRDNFISTLDAFTFKKRCCLEDSREEQYLQLAKLGMQGKREKHVQKRVNGRKGFVPESLLSVMGSS